MISLIPGSRLRRARGIVPAILRRGYWALAAALTLLVLASAAFALRPMLDRDGSYATRPFGLMTNVENGAADLLLQTRASAHANLPGRGFAEPITVIAVDERSIKESGVRLQRWSRESYARMIERASAGGAAAIGLDVFLSEAGGTSAEDRAADARLADVMAAAGNVVIVNKLEAGGTPAIEPLEVFADAAYATGFADLPHDSDGFIRSTMLARGTNEETDYSFGARLAELYLLAQHMAADRTPEEFYERSSLRPAGADAVRLGERTLALRADRNLQLDFRGRTPGFNIVAARDILSPDAPPLSDELFANRIVLIGATNVDAPDMFYTPFYEPAALVRIFDPALPRVPARMPGVEIHANAVATLLWGRALVRPSFTWQVALLAVPLLLAACAIFSLRALSGALVVGLLAVGVFAAAVWAFDARSTLLPLATAWAGLAVLTPAALGVRYAHERVLRDVTEAERAAIMDIFSKCVSGDVAERLWQQRGELMSGERRTVTIVFTDIRVFTTLSEHTPSDEVVRFLNAYFTRMHAVVDHHCGHINKFIGDGLMIVFGAPVNRGVEGEARGAAACALEMLGEVQKMNAEAEANGYPQIAIGIGIHTGEATCGVVGAEQRLEYTIIGDTVNLAARLESTTKEYGVPLLISEATARLVESRYEVRPLGEVTVKGKTASTPVYAIVEHRREPHD